MAKQKAAARKTAKPRSFLLTLALILLVGYFVITIVGLQLDIRERRAELDQKTAAYEEQLVENERLQSVIDDEDKSEYIEQVAREKLGYVMPGEKVFYDVTPGA